MNKCTLFCSMMNENGKWLQMLNMPNPESPGAVEG
jgi:hypothetical protein